MATHAGVVSLRVRPDTVEEAVRTCRDSVLPGLKGMQGFEGGYVLTDTETGRQEEAGRWFRLAQRKTSSSI